MVDALNFRLLRLVAEVADTGSLTQAAGRLHVVPSAASRRIRAAELALGVALIERSPRGAVLTPAGRLVVQQAQQVTRQLAQLQTQLHDLARGVRGRVALSAAASAIAQHLPEDLGGFARRHPDIQIDLQEHFSGAIVERLRQRQTDVGILIPPEPELPGLVLRPYRRERLVVVVPETHRLATHTRVAFAELLAEVWVGLPAETSLARQLHRQAASHGIALRTRIAVYGMDSMCRMVQHGLGIAILPAKAVSLAGRYPGLAVLALNEPWAERVLSVAVLADTELEPAAKALLEALTASAEREVVPLSQSFPTTTQETSS